MLRLFAVLILLLGICCHTTVGLSCKDENGRDVDWFYAIKLPVIPKDTNPAVASGYAYMYGDVNNPTLTWTTSSTLTQNKTGALAETLSQTYSATIESTAWIMYNDQMLGTEKDSYAHSKGVLAADNSEGFWLVHSVPRFPVDPWNFSTYYYPAYETENGQSFLCISLTSTVINQVADLFLTNKPYVFSSNFPASLSPVYPSITSVLASKWVTNPPTKITKLVSKGGQEFVAFAKTMKYGQDLYEDLVSPTFNASLIVQSWREGTLSDLMPSYCTPQYKYDNNNVLTISIRATDSFKTEKWAYTKDHSKWAVSSNGYACIGDINRMFSQWHRGGGTVCIQNKDVHGSLSSIIATYEQC